MDSFCIKAFACLYLLALLGFQPTAAHCEDEAKATTGTPTTASERLESWKHHVKLREDSIHRALKWRSVGPRMQGGRIESIACPPGNTSVMYVGVGSGNLWKTVNNGITWKPIFEHESTGAMGDVAVSRSDPNVVWLGTGEVLMARSALPGMGVFKSTNAGETWKSVGLHDTHHIGRVLIDPHDANITYVAAIGHRSTPNNERGVFKTVDGGKTWVRSLFIDDQTSAIDLVIDPSDRNTLYATTWHRAVEGQDHHGATSGVYKTQNAGETWQRLSGGLPEGDSIGRIAVDVSASNSNVVYALVDQGKEDGLYRSDDRGISWHRVNQDRVRASWDWCEIRVSPDNENELYNIGQRSFVSRDGGKTFKEIGGTIVHLLPHGSRTLHLDTHSMWIDPLNTDRIVFGNDGGLFFSYDRGENWLHVNNLPIAECYAVNYDMDQPYNIYTGTQDNAALFGPSTHVPEDGRPDAWKHVYLDHWGGGDSYFTFRDPKDRDTIYYEHQLGDLKRKTMSTGDTKSIRPRLPKDQPRLRFAWMTPFFLSTHNPDTLYCAANRVFKSLNRVDDWSVISPDLTVGIDPPNVRYKAITTMAESSRKPGLLFAGTDNGNLFVTRNDGKTWDSISNELPRRDFTRVIASPHDDQTVFVTLTGMGNDDFSPYVFRSDDQGSTWRSIANGLPLEPVHVIHEDPQVKDLLYIGTDLGVYVSSDGGVSWQSLCNNLPTTAVHDLVVHPRENELVIGTHGRSVYVLDVTTIQERAQTSKPARAVFADGQAQIVDAFKDAEQWIQHDLWVETTFDTDGDGKLDRMHVDVTRQRQTRTEGLKVPVIYESSPYFSGTGANGKQYSWDPRQEVGATPSTHETPPPIEHQSKRPLMSERQIERWVPRGFAVVHSASPGTGLSQGCPTVGGDNESLGPKAVIDWLNGRAIGYTTPDGDEQVVASWCTGKVGMTGTSYDGTIPLAAATTGVEGLEVIIPIAPNTSYYHYYRSHGLIRHPGGYMGEDIDVLYDWINSGDPKRREFCDCNVRDQEMMEGFDRVTGDYNEFWAGRDYINDLGPMKAAMLMAHGFNDWNVMPEHSWRIYDAVRAMGIPAQIYYHQGGHGGQPPMEMMNRWFSHYLYGVKNGVENGPKAWIVRENDKRSEPTAYADFPNPKAKPVTLHPRSRHGRNGTLVLSSRGIQGVATLIDDVSLSGERLARTEQSEHRLLFTTPELAAPLHLSGSVRLTIKLASSKPAVNLSVWLVSLPWDESSKKITSNIVTRGWADPQNHKSLTDSQPLEPGKFYKLSFDLQPDDQIIPVGQRLGLMIFSSDRDFTLWPEAGTELNVDLDATSLELPIVGGKPAFLRAAGRASWEWF